MTEAMQLKELKALINSMHKVSFYIGTFTIAVITIFSSYPGTFFYSSLIFLFPVFLICAGINVAGYLMIFKMRKLVAVEKATVDHGHVEEAKPRSFEKHNGIYYYCRPIYRYPLHKNCVLVFGQADISDLVRGSKEEANAIWANTSIKAIGRITPKDPK